MKNQSWDLVHLGEFDRDRWSVARAVSAVTDDAISVRKARRQGLADRRVMCWHPAFWAALPAAQKRGCRVLCYFHHYVFDYFQDRSIVAALCMNHTMRRRLEEAQPGKPVRRVAVGGAESASPYARRKHPTRRIRLLMVGNAAAPAADERACRIRKGTSRKGVEIILPLAEQLDPKRYAWVFVGPNWSPWASHLRAGGWIVIETGRLEDPGHYVAFGEGDVYLMLSRHEGGPLPLLEAMGLGIWPLATPTGIAPEVINHDDNGHLLPAFDGANAVQVAECAASLLESLPADRLTAARSTVRRSVAHRTWKSFRRQIDAAIVELLPPD